MIPSIGEALRQAMVLGVTFRLSGADVVMDGFRRLPPALRSALDEHTSYLWALFDDGRDREPVKLLASFGIEAIVVETRQQARITVHRLIADTRQHGGPIGFDIETAPKPEYAKRRPVVRFNKDGSFSSLQPGEKDHKDPAGVDPLRADIKTAQLFAGGNAYFFRSEALHILLRSNWLRRQRLVCHNAGFEIAFLQQVGYRAPPGRKPRGRIDDTEQAVGLCIGVGHGGERRGLDDAAAAMLGLKVPKHHQFSDWTTARLSSGQRAYAALDAIVCRQLWFEAFRTIRLDSLQDAYKLQRDAIIPVVDMTRRGLKLDTAKHAEQVDIWSRELAKARHEYVSLTGNPPPQTDNDVRRWLETILTPEERAKWKKTNKTECGQLCINANELNKLGHVPAARPVIDMRAKERLLNGFGASLTAKINPITGRIHCNFRIAAAKTGRFSSSNPNLQNLPASKAGEFRTCIVADTGNLLVVADYGQIEVRVAAFRSRDPILAAILAEGGDIHSANAALILGIPERAVTKEHRQQAKAVTFGVLYGQQAPGLAASAYVRFKVELTPEEAQSLIDRFFAAYPTLYRYLQYNAQICRNRGYVRIEPSGRLIRKEWEGWISYQDCCNWPIQGGAADLMLLAIVRVYRALRKAGIRGGMVATVHDELVSEVHHADATRVKEIMRVEMKRAFEVSFPDAPKKDLLKIGIGRNWKEAKEAGKTS